MNAETIFSFYGSFSPSYFDCQYFGFDGNVFVFFFRVSILEAEFI